MEGGIQGAGEGILLVEDELMLREFSTRFLSEHGYAIFDAGSTQEALDIFERERDNIKLVFSDVVLPDGNAIPLVEGLLAKSPGLKVVLTSGYPSEITEWESIKEQKYEFLQKPYTTSHMLKAIKGALKDR